MRAFVGVVLLAGCLGDGLAVPEPSDPEPPCCYEELGELVCRDAACPESAKDCQVTYLERVLDGVVRPIQIVYCY